MIIIHPALFANASQAIRQLEQRTGLTAVSQGRWAVLVRISSTQEHHTAP